MGAAIVFSVILYAITVFALVATGAVASVGFAIIVAIVGWVVFALTVIWCSRGATHTDFKIFDEG